MKRELVTETRTRSFVELYPSCPEDSLVLVYNYLERDGVLFPDYDMYGDPTPASKTFRLVPAGAARSLGYSVHESIAFETDPHGSATRRALRHEIDICRNQIRQIYRSQLSRSRFAANVRRNTHGLFSYNKFVGEYYEDYIWFSPRANKHYADSRETWRLIMSLLRLHPAEQDRFVSHYQGDRAGLGSRLRWVRDHNNPSYLSYHNAFPQPIFAGSTYVTLRGSSLSGVLTNSDEATGFILRRPVTVRQTVPNRDWHGIRESWLGAVAQACKDTRPLYKRLRSLNKRLSQVSIFTHPDNHRCRHVYTVDVPAPFESGATIANVTFPPKLFSLHAQMGPSLGPYGAMGIELPGNHLPPSYENTVHTVLTGSNAYRCSLDWEATWGTDGQSMLPADRTDGEWYSTKRMINLHNIVVGSASSWRYRNYMNGVLMYSDHIAQDAFSQAPRHTESVYSTDSIDVPAPAIVNRAPRGDLGINLAEKRTSALNRLANLDLPEDDQNFVLARSAGELKDTPQTLASARAFLRWVRSAEETPFVRYRTVGGVWRTYAVGTVGTALDRQALAIAQGNLKFPNAAAMRRATGIRNVSGVSRVTRASPLGVLTSVYLAWKFGVSQTIADTNTLCKHTWNWATTVRRGLAQMHTEDPHMLVNRAYRVNYSEADDPSVPCSTKRKSFVLEMPSRHVELKELYAVTPHIYEALKTPGNRRWDVVEPITGYPVIQGLNIGFWIRSPFVDSDAPRFATYVKNIRLHNRELLINKGFLDKSCLCLLRRAYGTVYARFSRSTIFRALRRSGENLWARLRAAQTMWELAPLSFVVEWFTNIGEMIRQADALMGKSLSRINPIGKIWETRKIRYWLARPESNFTVTTQVTDYQSHLCLIERNIDAAPVPSVGSAQRLDHTRALDLVGNISVSYTVRQLPGRTLRYVLSPIKWFIRRSVDEPLTVSPLRIRMRLTWGKLGSLLLIALQPFLGGEKGFSTAAEARLTHT